MRIYRSLTAALVSALMLATLIVAPLLAQSSGPAGQGVYPVYRGKNVSAAITSVVYTGAGMLHTVCVNTKGTAAKVYLDVTGTGTNNLMATIDTSLGVGCFLYDVAFSTGLTIVTTGATTDLTAAYRPLQ